MTEGEPLRKAVEAGQLRGKSAAMAHTLIETAKLDGVDPQACLTDALGRISENRTNRVDELLPWRYDQIS